MCFHLGMTEAFVWNYGTKEQRFTEWPETVEILREIYKEIVKDDRRLVYSHKVSASCFGYFLLLVTVINEQAATKDS